jgi:membrane peptidoglycan carboxypeptidase
MENVHGIAVSGGSFPATIWRLFMEQALAGTEPADFAPASQSPEWTTFERGPYALTYDPYYTPPQEETEEEDGKKQNDGTDTGGATTTDGSDTSTTDEP